MRLMTDRSRERTDGFSQIQDCITEFVSEDMGKNPRPPFLIGMVGKYNAKRCHNKSSRSSQLLLLISSGMDNEKQLKLSF